MEKVRTKQPRCLAFWAFVALSGCAAEVPKGADSAPAHDASSGGLAFTGAVPQNVIMISIDTFARTRMGRYSGGALTPRLDWLAENGVAFDDHASCSAWTYPSINCALTGRYNQDLGYEPRVSDSEAMPPLPAEATTLAESLGAVGFHTRVLSANMYLADHYGTTQGYQEQELSIGMMADDVTWRVLQGADTLTEPFFLHVHYIDPHSPYAPPPAYAAAEVTGLDPIPWDLSTEEGAAAARDAWTGLDQAGKNNLMAWLRALYDGEIEYVDQAVGALLDGLDAAGKLQDSLVVVWTDHGEEFKEHGAWGHAGQLYNDQADAIGIFWSAGIVADARSTPTSHVDLAPTILETLSLPIPPEVSGSPLGAPTGGTRFGFLYTKQGNASASVQRGGLKLHYTWWGHKELFNRVVDPTETDNRYSPDSAEVVALWELLKPRVLVEASIIGVDPVDVGP